MKQQNKSVNGDSISVIINAHNENLLFHRTLKSVNENIKLCKKKNISVEVIIVADKVDDPTLDYIKNRAKLALTEVSFQLECVNYGDLGESRNHGIRLAKGEFIANIDGDDLWSTNWLVGAIKALKETPASVVHPAAVLNFGSKNGVWHVRKSTEPVFNPRSVVEDNWWPSTMMTHRATFDDVQYRRVDRPNEFSFEDWLFNNETLAAGYEHITAPETIFFYRRKPVSMLTAHISGLPEPNPMFTLKGQTEYRKKRRLAQQPLTSRLRQGAKLISRDSSRVRRIAVKSIKGGGKLAVRAGRRLFKGQLKTHHRLKQYLRDVKSATHVLISDYSNEMPTGQKVIPGWLRAKWLEANAIEPDLFPTYHRVNTAYSRQMMTMGLEQQAYWEIMKMLDGKADYILLMPYVRKAGAYMVGMHYLKAYKQLYPQKKAVVLATELTYPSDDTLVPADIELVTVPESFDKLTKDLKSRVLAKLFTNIQPKYVHALHSQEGFRALQRYPKQISKYSKIFLSTFNYDYTSQGQKMNALVAYGEPILPYVTKVFTDNEWVAQDTVNVYGVDKKYVVAHKMPIGVSEDTPSHSSVREIDGKMRILWAARMAKQK